MKHLLVAAGCLAGLTLCATSPVAAQPPATKTVLAIYSQGRETAIDAFDVSLRNTLRTVSGDTVTYYAEFMDSSRFAGDQQLRLFRDFLSRKYDGRTMDAVVLVGRGAAKVVSGNRPLFAGVPTVFYTLDQADVEAPVGAFRLVGTFADDERRTLSLALALHPDTRQVFVVVNTMPEGPPYESNIRTALATLENRVAIRYLVGLPPDTLIATLQSAPAESLVLYVRPAPDRSGAYGDSREVLSLLERQVHLPVYGGFAINLGYGVVGGYMYSSDANGAAAGALAWRLANGEHPPAAAANNAPTIPTFDWRQLRRWRIDESQLPAGSVIKFREPTFWSRYRRYAIGGLIVFAAQLALIGMLLLQARRRRRAEQALRESEERYRRVVEAQTDLLCRMTPDSTLTFVNEAYCRYRKMTAAELIGTKVIERFPDAERDPIAQHLASIVQPPHRGRHEVPFVRDDGSPGWQEWVTQGILGEDGQVRELLATGRDITENKRSEEALRRSEARNGAMLRAMPDLLFVMSRDGVYLDYHARNPDDLFVPPEQFLGKTVFEIMPPDLAGRFAVAFADAHATGEARSIEYELPLKDGTSFFECRIVGIDADQVLSVVRNVTEQRRAEKRLRQNEARYAMATAAGGVGVWDWTLETDELYVDPELLRILGYTGLRATAQRVNWQQLVSPVDYARTRAAAQACIDGSTTRYNIEHRVMHRDGSLRWFHTSGSAVRRDDGTAYRMMGTFTDVTDRIRAETAVRDRDSALRASYRTIHDLAGRLITGQELEFKRLARELHDNLSQSLALLAIDVELLTRQGHVSPEASTIADRVARIAGDVHLLSHRLHPFKLEALGLVAAVRSLCDDVSKQHALTIDFQSHPIPAKLPPDIALCLFRIAQEGLRNIVKHSQATAAQVLLTVSDSDLSLHISDGGVGFDPEENNRSGLGLISIRERVNVVGGLLAVVSSPGAGTRIAVSVPLKGEADEAMQEERTAVRRIVESA